jgi:hypothetical protein
VLTAEALHRKARTRQEGRRRRSFLWAHPVLTDLGKLLKSRDIRLQIGK